MKIVVQRVKHASVTTEGKKISEIKHGLLVLVGIGQDDTEEAVRKVAQKIIKLRIFADDKKDINRSVVDVKGSILAVSQFTLLADTSAGNRPSFVKAAQPEVAKPLFDTFVEELKKEIDDVQTGAFGEYMDVELVNDGPVTIVY